MSIRKMVSLPEVSVQRSSSSICKAWATSNLAMLTRQQPEVSATSTDRVLPATWKKGRMLK